MKKGVLIALICIFALAAAVLGGLYYTNNSNLTGQIETLNADVADKAGQIDALNADVADKAGQIDALNADVADKAGQIDALNAEVADKAEQIDALNADVADKAEQIDALNADVADKAEQIDALNADVADKAEQIDALNADVADKAEQIEALKTNVADKVAGVDYSGYSEEILLDVQRAVNAELSNRTKSVVPVIGDTLDGWTFDSTYVSNEYYDIVETGYFEVYRYTVLVHKVFAKQDVSLTSTIIASAADGSVVGKSSDEIILTQGKYNYFAYYFEGDIYDATMNVQVKTREESSRMGERNAVEMVQYNQTGDYLYITLRQVADERGSYPKFKILLYQEDKIVGIEECSFNVYAENISGKGTTDVAAIRVRDKQIDRIEYIFEP